MRSFLLVLMTLCVAAFGFAVYWLLQGADQVGNVPQRGAAIVADGATTLPSMSPGGTRPGTKPYWEQRDAATGEITARMRAASYEFLKDGRARVNKPEIEFYLHDGQLVRIMGEVGTITMDDVGKVGSRLGGSVGIPRNGELQNVQILMLPSATATKPTLTAITNNVAFDNETFQVQSAAYEADGQTVPPQLVPVTVRGEDYEFDGRGLRMRYDEVHRRLDYLEISYGQRLLVKHPRKFMKGSGAGEKPRALGDGAAGAALPGVVLAAATPAGVKAALGPGARPIGPGAAVVEEPVYRATFEQNVEVYQAGERMATAQTLQVDFLGRSGDDLSSLGLGRGATQPATLKTAASAASAEAAKPVPAAATTRRAVAKTAPATQADEQPLEIRWRGPLTVRPIAGDRPERIAPGESIIRMSSGPGRLVEIDRTTEQGRGQLRCAALTHWTIDGGVLLEAAPGVPVQLTDSRGGNLVTQYLLFSQKDGTALLTGKSGARIPLQATAENDAARSGGKTDTMDVSWSERCTLHLTGPLDDMALDRADLQGHVVANHPRVQLSAQAVQLAFSPPTPAGAAQAAATTQPQRAAPVLRQMDASGNVICVAHGPGGEADVRRIGCDTLTLMTARTAAGELYAQKLVAIGQVQAVDADRNLKAGFVAVTLAAPSAKKSPATQPLAGKAEDDLAGQLESLIAHENVRVTTANGEAAQGDELVIKTEGSETEATLHGRPATVTRGKNVLSGPILDMLQERQQLTVTGEGKLNGMTEQKPGRPARPVVVTWKTSMRANGKENLIECFGGVTATTLSDDNGSETVVRGERVKILTTQPAATQPVDGASDEATKRRSDEGNSKGASTRPTTRPGEFDNLGDRQVRSIALEDSAQVDSKVFAEGGDLLRLFHAESASILYDREARKLTIPQAGQMLFMDNRPAAVKPTAVEAAKDPMGIRGNTAFKWSKSLVYDELGHLVTLSGDVRVSRANTGDVEPMVLDADTVIAEIEPAADAGPGTKPAGGAGLDSDLGTKVQFKRVRAEGNITIESKQFSAEAASIDYDPAKHELIVRGTRNRQATQFEVVKGQKMPVASFDELIWNTAEARVVNATELRAVGSRSQGGGNTMNPRGDK